MKLAIPNRKAFTAAALRQWDKLDPTTQAKNLGTAWCGLCRRTTHIQVRSAKMDRRVLLLSGLCGHCGSNVAHTVERQ
jgi:hypothetical protein